MSNPKRDAALAQVTAMRGQGLDNATIKVKLMETGLSEAQVNDLLGVKKPEPIPSKPLDDDTRSIIVTSACDFLRALGTRTNKYADRYPELGSIRDECLGVAVKLERCK